MNNFHQRYLHLHCTFKRWISPPTFTSHIYIVRNQQASAMFNNFFALIQASLIPCWEPRRLVIHWAQSPVQSRGSSVEFPSNVREPAPGLASGSAAWNWPPVSNNWETCLLRMQTVSNLSITKSIHRKSKKNLVFFIHDAANTIITLSFINFSQTEVLLYLL